ncbi:MAG: hypothetical protein IPQ27_08805 [Chitinophagaceae bacterium]|nr:hypothetical protein [Chitinophagaceae bacterium]
MSKVLGLDLGQIQLGGQLLIPIIIKSKVAEQEFFQAKQFDTKELQDKREGTYLQLSTCFTSFHLQQFYYHCMIEPVGNFSLIYL